MFYFLFLNDIHALFPIHIYMMSTKSNNLYRILLEKEIIHDLL